MSKYKIKPNTFSGEYMGQFNGQIVTMESDKTTKQPVQGKSGKTKAYALPSGGRLYLEDSQVETA